MTMLNSWGQGPVQHLQHPTEKFVQTDGAGIAGVCITPWYLHHPVQNLFDKEANKREIWKCLNSSSHFMIITLNGHTVKNSC